VECLVQAGDTATLQFEGGGTSLEAELVFWNLAPPGRGADAFKGTAVYVVTVTPSGSGTNGGAPAVSLTGQAGTGPMHQLTSVELEVH
jgi:hypothetical protein